MEAYIKFVWLGLLILFGAVEAVSVGLTSIWFAAGALAALIAALAGGSLCLQIILFLAVSVLCLLAVRPLARKHLNNKVEPTNADRVIGAQAFVVEEINNLSGTGSVNVGGTVWTARSADDTVIPADAQVRVLRIEGVKVYVTVISKEES